jgi:hypothetical protein
VCIYKDRLCVSILQIQVHLIGWFLSLLTVLDMNTCKYWVYFKHVVDVACIGVSLVRGTYIFIALVKYLRQPEFLTIVEYFPWDIIFVHDFDT